MKSLPDKIRIKDIARLANVSTGTVDRVLHNRGEVSAKSREKVEKVLKEINYQPNIYACLLYTSVLQLSLQKKDTHLLHYYRNLTRENIGAI